MTELLTLFGRELSELSFKQLQREWRSQKHILHLIRAGRTTMVNVLAKRVALEEAGEKKKWSKQIQEDKIMLMDIYITHLEYLVEELEYWMSKRAEPKSNATSKKTVSEIKARNVTRYKRNSYDRNAKMQWERRLKRDTFAVSWDKDKFLLIAKDRGYQTELGVIHDVGKELNLDRMKAEAILNSGRFTWGQVLCLGAMLQMTPREFCDTFLSGYFIEHNDDEYRADYENIERLALLRYAIKPALPPLEEVVVGSDGRPIDEETWFDED